MVVRDSAEETVAGNANLSTMLPWEKANPKWAATLNPLLANPLVSGRIINDVAVVTGDNVINHGLGDTLQGYIVIGNNANVTVYDKQQVNPRPYLTLILVASGAAVLSLYVF